MNKADVVMPPVEGETRVYSLGAGDTSIEIPRSWHGAYLTMIAEGADISFVFGDSGTQADPAAHTGSNPTEQCIVLRDGERVDLFIPFGPVNPRSSAAPDPDHSTLGEVPLWPRLGTPSHLAVNCPGVCLLRTWVSSPGQSGSRLGS